MDALAMLGMLVVVVGILYLSYYCTKNIGKIGRFRTRSNYMNVVDQVPVGQDRSLTIVQTGDTYLLLGITSAQITVLKELNADELASMKNESQEMAEPLNFQSIMEKLGKRK